MGSMRVPLLAFAAGTLLALVVGYALMGRDRVDESAPAPAQIAHPPADPPSAPDATAMRAREPAAVPSVAPSDTLVLDRASFPTAGPVRVNLGLAEPSADDEPRPVRLISQPDHRILEIPGALAADRSSASIEVDPGYLQPGLYLVEVKTTEPGVFSLQRYFLEVR